MSDSKPTEPNEPNDEASTQREAVEDELSLARSSDPDEQLRSGVYDGSADPALTKGYESGLETLEAAQDAVEHHDHKKSD